MTFEETLSITGDQRASTFWRTWQLAHAIGAQCIIETGCFRGIEGDGQSTRFLAMLAESLKADFYSVDINQSHIDASKKRADELGLIHIKHTISDSVQWLSLFRTPIQLVYLDSYDFEPTNPLPSQIHQLAELGAVCGKLAYKAIILCDDCGIAHGGKGKLSEEFILSRGWKKIESGYQSLFINF